MNVSPQCIYSAHRRIILNWTLWPLFPLHLSAASMWYRGVGGACRYYGFVVCRREWRYFRLTKDRTDVHTINGYYKFLATSGTMIVVHDAKVVASAEFKHTWGFERVKCVFRVAGLACPIVVTHWPLNSFTGHQTLSIGLGSSGSELRVYSRRTSATTEVSGETQICSASLLDGGRSAFVCDCVDRLMRFPCGLFGKQSVAERLCVEPSDTCEFMWPDCPPIPEEVCPTINAILGWLQTSCFVES